MHLKPGYMPAALIRLVGQYRWTFTEDGPLWLWNQRNAFKFRKKGAQTQRPPSTKPRTNPLPQPAPIRCSSHCANPTRFRRHGNPTPQYLQGIQPLQSPDATNSLHPKDPLLQFLLWKSTLQKQKPHRDSSPQSTPPILWRLSTRTRTWGPSSKGSKEMVLTLFSSLEMKETGPRSSSGQSWGCSRRPLKCKRPFRYYWLPYLFLLSDLGKA